MGTVGAWLEQRCHKDPTAETDAGKLYVDYREWADEAGERPVTRQRLGRSLADRGFSKRKSGGHVWYRGISLGVGA